MPKEFYSNGKLLLTAEYAILDGAIGLALPTKFGQHLTVSKNDSEIISWKSRNEHDDIWFQAEFSTLNLKTISSTSDAISNRLAKILAEAHLLNPAFLSDSKGYAVETKLTFNKDWGLGSSSTLITNISKWAERINPYQLLAGTFGGSGYDIACATHNKPILYQKNNYTPMVHEVDFKPEFTNQLFFIYLNQKKNSREAITAYKKLVVNKNDLILKINDITSSILKCTQLNKFEELLTLHEETLSQILGVATIKESMFKDYRRAIKSLGAWGGDFVLATGDFNDMNYFREKGYMTILPYSEMIL